MKNICVSWVGMQDIKSSEKSVGGVGPVIALLRSEYAKTFDEIHLLCDFSDRQTSQFETHLRSNHISYILHRPDLPDPTNYKSIYEAVTSLLNDLLKKHGSEIQWHFHTSPGTSAMAAVWVLLGKTRYSAVLYKSWIDDKGTQKVNKVEIPFNLEMDYIPELLKDASKAIATDWDRLPLPDLPEFGQIVHESAEMKRLISMAHRVAIHDVPVLILGETGTGKELFANAIHAASARSKKPLKTINCAALPESIVDATLFGWSKGAYTGSVGEGLGLFRDSDGGTVFLDEIGDLTANLQVKLLRVLQQGEIQRVGDGKVFNVDVRIIAATNKDLPAMVANGQFREDLFHRISVGVLKLPPLKDRGKDTVLIAENLLAAINAEFREVQGKDVYKHKNLSVSAKKFISAFAWPGNVRELFHTLKRAALWASKETLTDTDIENAIVRMPVKPRPSTPSLHEDHPLDLEGIMSSAKREYIEEALKVTGGVITRAAKLLGYSNYQTLKNHMKILGVKT